MNLPFCYSLHKQLWLWLANNPDKYEIDWPEWTINGGDIEPILDCNFACQYVSDLESNCSNCPLSWTKDNTCLYSNSIYLKWLFSNNPKDRKLCARQIAVINVKKDVNIV